MILTMAREPSAQEKKRIESIIDRFSTDQNLVERFMKSILEELRVPKLKPFVHSIKSRVKEPDRLCDKLIRKLNACKAEGRPFEYTPENLYEKITDLAGVRILHLHTRQIVEINRYINEMIEEQSLTLVEKPSARTWDDEYRQIFKDAGIDTQVSPTLYTSVHYVVGAKSKTPVTCEIQVRTLMEEVWGEVDHTINYPHPNASVACREQIRALARVTSSSTRLVDAIFATVDDLKNSTVDSTKHKAKKRR